MKPRQLAERICAVLHDAGHQAYFVGGCVRDLLLGIEPADYDVATDAIPQRVQELFPGSFTVGAHFGVIIVREDSVQVEVATFRSDLAYSDGRHPDGVVFSASPEQDAHRRDFTINGLLFDPRAGEVLDFVGGRVDLQAGIIRAIGEPARRFAEDRLRMLRAVRFAARFGYRVDELTFAAIHQHAASIGQVSAERIRNELTRILTEGGARRGFELLDKTSLLSAVLPEIVRMKGVEQPPQFHPEGDVWNHTMLMLEKLPPGTPVTLAWGVLLHDVGKPPTFAAPRTPQDRIRFDGHVETGIALAAKICARLRFSTDDTEQIQALIANHMRFIDVHRMRVSTLKRFARLSRFQEEHLELHRLDCISSHQQLDSYNFVADFLAKTPPEIVRPARLVTGDDLLLEGLRPGPRFRQILEAVEEAQLEGKLANRDEALAYARTLIAAKASIVEGTKFADSSN
ncbi:MAG: CCA tRNA nucleotidyltransferase [Acidipila sp.]|nr:CCA tRNA nucleotidyltransferase [Acidipila sp.]